MWVFFEIFWGVGNLIWIVWKCKAFEVMEVLFKCLKKLSQGVKYPIWDIWNYEAFKVKHFIYSICIMYFHVQNARGRRFIVPRKQDLGVCRSTRMFGGICEPARDLVYFIRIFDYRHRDKINERTHDGLRNGVLMHKMSNLQGEDAAMVLQQSKGNNSILSQCAKFCFYCGKSGHIVHFCYKEKKQRTKNKSPTT